MQSIYRHDDSRQVATVVNQIVQALDSVTGTVTVANSATTTTVTNAKVTAAARIFLQPRNANAAAAGAFISTISNGSFVITHNNATTERKFDYLIFTT